MLNGHWWPALQGRLGYIKILVLKKKKKEERKVYTDYQVTLKNFIFVSKDIQHTQPHNTLPILR